MSETTEIYLCRAGQSLQQGRVEYSDSIANRDEARRDAETRCARNNRLAKVAYYAVNEEGDFRIIYTHNNPNAVGLQGPDEKKPKKKKKPVKKPLLTRLVEAVTEKVLRPEKTKKTKKPKK